MTAEIIDLDEYREKKKAREFPIRTDTPSFEEVQVMLDLYPPFLLDQGGPDETRDC